VASAAAIEIETRAQALGNCLNLVEYVRSCGEKGLLVLAETRKRAASARRAASRTRINRLLCGASSPGTATATPVVWCEILSKVAMQIEAASILSLRESRP